MIWLLARRYFHKKGLQFLQKNRIVCVKHLTIKNDQQLDMRQWRKNEANHTKHKNSALFFLERFYFLRKSQQCKISKKQNNPLTVVKIIFVGHPIFRPLNYCCILAHARVRARRFVYIWAELTTWVAILFLAHAWISGLHVTQLALYYYVKMIHFFWLGGIWPAPAFLGVIWPESSHYYTMYVAVCINLPIQMWRHCWHRSRDFLILHSALWYQAISTCMYIVVCEQKI